MPKYRRYKATVEVDIEIAEQFVVEGYNVGDMVQEAIGDAFNGHGLEWVITSVDTVDEVKD